VLVTNLAKRTQPLIRYEISDSVTLAAGANPAGLPYRCLAGIDGRSDDILQFPGRAGGSVRVHPYRLRAPFAGLPEVRQYQIVRTARGLDVRVVAQASAALDMPERVRAAVEEALENAGAAPTPVDVVLVDEIERESGHAAKLKLVKNLAGDSRAG